MIYMVMMKGMVHAIYVINRTNQVKCALTMCTFYYTIMKVSHLHIKFYGQS